GLEAVAHEERGDLGELFAGKEHYALKVRGQSMIDDHIDDGDYVILKKQETAENGERAAAVVERAGTLKKFCRRKQRVVLEPANSTTAPIVVAPDRDIKIMGVLVGVVRKV